MCRGTGGYETSRKRPAKEEEGDEEERKSDRMKGKQLETVDLKGFSGVDI